MTDYLELFANGITREGLIKIFNPYDCMLRTEDDFFKNEVYQALEQNNTYDELRILPFYTTYIDKNREALFEAAIIDFLSYKDGMHFYPTIQEWSNSISAPEDFIKKILPDNGVNLSILLGNDFWCRELNIIFHKKIKEMEDVEEDNFDEGKFEFSDNYFTDYLSDRFSETVKKQWEKYLSKEFEVGKRLHDAWENREKYFSIAKEQNLTVMETIMLFIDYAFSGYIK